MNRIKLIHLYINFIYLHVNYLTASSAFHTLNYLCKKKILKLVSMFIFNLFQITQKLFEALIFLPRVITFLLVIIIIDCKFRNKS